MRKQLTTFIFILAQLLLTATPLLAVQASAQSNAIGTAFGTVWLDRNGSGTYDLNESTRANVIVEIKNTAGELIQSTMTDADGNYFFMELEYGEYGIWNNSINGVASFAGTVHIAEVNGTASFNIPLGPEAIDDSNMLVRPEAIDDSSMIRSVPEVANAIFLPLINN